MASFKILNWIFSFSFMLMLNSCNFKSESTDNAAVKENYDLSANDTGNIDLNISLNDSSDVSINITDDGRGNVNQTTVISSGETSTGKKIEIKTFTNSDVGGYGYDIFIDGKMYVHQPTIPAVQGNKGFASEELARRVAELAVSKIRRNILPPTIEVSELDSMGVK